MSRDQTAGRSDNMKTDNSFFERVEKLKSLVTTSTIQNYFQEEIKSRLKSGNACYHSVQNLFIFKFAIKDLKVKIYINVTSLVFFYGCQTWSLTFIEELG
jgi:hypothetical protein